MFQIVTINLSLEATTADVAHGSIDVGELTADEFAALLERFRRLDPVQNHDADPHLIVTARAGKFRIRTSQGKLFVDTPRDTSQPFTEMTVAEIVRQLDIPPKVAEFDETEGATAKTPTPNRGIAFAILAAGLALNGYTLYSVFYTETVNEKPAVTLLTDPKEITAHQDEVVGTFVTGEQPGDRTITVEASGHIKFAEIGARAGYNNNTDQFRLGKHGRNYCLATVESGVVDVLNIDTLTYYRDTYRRKK